MKIWMDILSFQSKRHTKSHDFLAQDWVLRNDYTVASNQPHKILSPNGVVTCCNENFPSWKKKSTTKSSSNVISGKYNPKPNLSNIKSIQLGKQEVCLIQQCSKWATLITIFNHDNITCAFNIMLLHIFLNNWHHENYKLLHHIYICKPIIPIFYAYKPNPWHGVLHMQECDFSNTY